MVLHVDAAPQKEILADLNNNNSQAMKKHIAELESVCADFQKNLKATSSLEKIKTPEGKRVFTRFTNLCTNFSKNTAINFLESMI